MNERIEPRDALAPVSPRTGAVVPSSSDGARGAEASELHVVFRIAQVWFALPARDVLQMESFTGATPVPGAPPYVAGIIQLRGRVVPVVDLRARFGMPAVAPEADARVVVGEHEGRAVALLADAAREVVRIGGGQVEPPPPILATGAGGFVKGVAHVGERTLLVLDFEKVIGEDLHG